MSISMLGPDMTCAREFVTQVCCSASEHYAARHRFPTMKSAQQNRRSPLGTTAKNQCANPTALFGIGIGYSLLFHVATSPMTKCVMNGSNHLPESDARTLHLCPVSCENFNGVLDRFRE